MLRESVARSREIKQRWERSVVGWDHGAGQGSSSSTSGIINGIISSSEDSDDSESDAGVRGPWAMTQPSSSSAAQGQVNEELPSRTSSSSSSSSSSDEEASVVAAEAVSVCLPACLSSSSGQSHRAEPSEQINEMAVQID